MPRASKEQAAATAESILSIAGDLFSTEGFAAVSLDDVATRAAVTRGAVYHHYGSKAGLFRAVVERAQTHVAEQVEAATVGVTDPWESLERGCRAFMEASTDGTVRRALLIDGPAVLGWEEWRAQDAANSGALLDDVLAELAEAGLLSVPTSAAAALLNGAMNEGALWIAGSTDRSRALDEAWAVLQRQLRALR